MAFTQEQLDALESAIASGELRVKYGDPPREVEYRSMTDLMRARDTVRASLGKSPNVRVRTWGYRRSS